MAGKRLGKSGHLGSAGELRRMEGRRVCHRACAGVRAEALEGRVLLSGISGTVFDDQNGDGVLQGSENGLPGWMVFVDGDGDGALGQGEISARTDYQGAYTLWNVGAGTQRVRTVIPPQWRMAAPALLVDVPAGATATGKNLAAMTDVPRGTSMPAGAEFLVSADPVARIAGANVSANRDGKYVVAWRNDTGLMYARQFSADGREPGLNVPLGISDSTPRVAVDVDGGFAVAWRDNSMVKVRRFDPAGNPVGEGVTLDSQGSSYDGSPSIAAQPAGGFIVAWTNANGKRIDARRLAASGAPAGSTVTLVARESAGLSLPVVVADAAGNIALTWFRPGTSSGSNDFCLQRFDSAGAPLGGEQVLGVNATYGELAIGAEGHQAAAWVQARGSAGSAVMAQRFDAQGRALGDAFECAVSTGSVSRGAVAVDGDGATTVSWGTSNNSQVWARRYNAAGAPEGGAFRIGDSGYRNGPRIAAWGGGFVINTYARASAPESPSELVTQRYASSVNPASIEGRAWEDANGDGIQTEGEPRMPWVTVNLLNDAGKTIATTITNEQGEYRFDEVVPGAGVRVRFGGLQGYAWTAMAAGDDRAADSDVDAMGVTGALPVEETSTLSHVDAGMYRPVQIAGTVFHDVNGNGWVDVGERALGGWVVYLDANENGALDAGERSNVTDSQGTFVFDSLPPGRYTIAQIPVSGWEAAGPVRTNLIESGQSRIVDLATRGGGETPAVVAGRVWDDLDGDGVQDAGEPGRAGVTVRLLNSAGVARAAAVTSAGGDYRFEKVPRGEAMWIEVERQALWVFSPRDAAADAIDSDVEGSSGRAALMLMAGDAELRVDAGMYFPGRVHGTIFSDDDGNGVRNGAESLLGGWIVFVDDDEDGQLDPSERFTQSDANGVWTLDPVVPGERQIAVLGQDHWTFTGEVASLRLMLGAGEERWGVDVGQRTEPLVMGRTFTAERTVNSTTAGEQRNPAIATNSAGERLVVWQSQNQDGSGWGVYGARFNGVGEPVGTELAIHTTTAWDQLNPAVALDGRGVGMVVWQSASEDGSGWGIYGQRLDASGAKLGSEFRVNSTTAGHQTRPAVVVVETGDFLVVWQGPDEDGEGIFGQWYDAEGAARGGEIRINGSPAGNQASPAAAAGGDGALVVWQEGNGAQTKVVARRWSVGEGVWSEEAPVNMAAASDPANPAVGMGGDGAYCIAWQGPDGNGVGIVARRFNRAGTPQGAEFRVNRSTYRNQVEPAVAMDSDGNLTIAWTNEGTGTSYPQFTFQRYNRAGVPQGGEGTIHSDSYYEREAVLAALPGNGVVCAYRWASTGDVRMSGFAQWSGAAMVAGRIWEDANGNNRMDADEAGLDRWSVAVRSESGQVVAWMETKLGGYYWIDSLKPGRYVVQLKLPDGRIFSLPNDAEDELLDSDIEPLMGSTAVMDLNANAANLALNAGLIVPATISGVAFLDRDGDGARDPGEGGLPGWIVLLDDNGNGQADPGEPTSLTGKDGGYTLSGVRPGSQRVSVLAQEQWTQTTPDHALTMSIAPGMTLAGMNVGLATEVPAAFVGPVGGETRLNAASASAAARDGSGNCVLVWGETSPVWSTIIEYFVQRFAADGTQLGERQRVTQGLMYVQRSSVTVAMNEAGAFVVAWFESSYATGTLVKARRFDPNGIALGDVFQASTTSATSATDLTVAIDAAGRFAIAWIEKGAVYLQRYDAEGQRAGVEQVAMPPAAGGTYRAITLRASGEMIGLRSDQVTSDSGTYYYRLLADRFAATGELLGGGIVVDSRTGSQYGGGSVAIAPDGSFVIGWGGRLWRYNREGIRQGGAMDVGASDLITIDADGGMVAVSGGSGRRLNAAGAPEGEVFRISATSLAPTPLHVWTGPDGAVVVTWTTGGNGGVFAQRFEGYVETATVNGKVWSDTNGNGVQEQGEGGRDGVTVNLLNEAGAHEATAVTAGGGLYRFESIRAGSAHRVQVVAPSDSTLTRAGEGGNASADSDVAYGVSALFTIAAGATERIDAGLSAASSVSGAVFQDYDGDGRRDAGEEGLVGAYVYVDVDGDGAMDPTEPAAVSGPDGAYTLSNLPAGALAVSLSLPTLWRRSGGEGAVAVTTSLGKALANVDFGAVPTVGATMVQALSPWSRVSQFANSQKGGAQIAFDAAGNFVIAWSADRRNGTQSEIYARRFGADGMPLGDEFLVNTVTPSSEFGPRVAMAPTGEFVIGWSSSAPGMFGQRFSASGERVGEAFAIGGDDVASAQLAALGMDGEGGLVAVFGVQGPLWGRRYDKRGAARGEVFALPGVEHLGSSVAILPGGGIIVAWQDPTAGYLRRFDVSGSPLGSTVELGRVRRQQVAIAVDAAGNFAVARTGQLPMSRIGVFVQRYDGAGNRQGAEALVAKDASDEPLSVSLSPSGEMLVRWSGWGGWIRPAYLQHVSPAGALAGDAIPVSAGTTAGFDAAGNLTFMRDVPDGNNSHIEMQRYAAVTGPTPVITGTEGADRYTLRRKGESVEVYREGNGFAIATFEGSALNSMRFEGLGGDDALVIDYAGGDPTPTGGVWFEGGEGTDVLTVAGTTAGDAVRLNVAGGAGVGVSGVERLVLGDGTAGAVAVGSLSIEGALKVEVAGEGRRVELGALALGVAATIDLGNHVLVLACSDAADAAAKEAMVRGWVVSARENGGGAKWQGPGLTSTLAAANPEMYAVVAFKAEEAGRSAVIARPAAFGDTNFDGNVDADDYFRMDRGRLAGLAGWENGDVDENGAVDADDYQRMDAAYQRQTLAAKPQALSAAVASATQGSLPFEVVPLASGESAQDPLAWWPSRDNAARPGLARRVLFTDDLAVWAMAPVLEP